MLFHNIAELIGKTPLLEAQNFAAYQKVEAYLLCKLECFNPAGSAKDRVALSMLNDAEERGLIKEGATVIEPTSGNTGISLSAMGAFFGNPVHIFMPDWVSKERLNLMKMYNAKVTLISKEEGGFKRAIREAIEYSIKNNAFYSNQFENEDNILAHYETTGKEITESLKDINGFVSGIGTGGTLMGISKRLKENNKNIKIYALEPDKMPLLSQNKIYENHKIEGIGDDFIPKIVDKEKIDKVIVVNDDDAVNMSKKIALNLGLGVGISSGANMIASVIAKEENEGNIVTVFPDDNKKYLSTDLSKELDNKQEYISNKVELIGYDFV